MNDEIFSIIGLGFFWGNVYGGFLAMLGEEIYEKGNKECKEVRECV